MKSGITLSKDNSGRITVTSPYNPQRVEKIKTIPGHRWHPAEKHWSFPNAIRTVSDRNKLAEIVDLYRTNVIMKKEGGSHNETRRSENQVSR